MRIAHIVRRYVASEWGGTETVVAATVAEQLKLGDEPRVFCTAALQSPDGERAFPYFYPYFPMPPKDRLALDKKGGSPYSPALFRAVGEFRPDVIHIHAGGRLATAAVRLAERLGVPSVMSLHGGAADVPQAEIDEMMRPMRGKIPYGAVIDRLLGLRFDPLARVKAIVCISKLEEERLKARYPGQSVNYLPNGVAEPKFFPSDVKRDPRHVLCVSRIDYQKNQLALVEAMGMLNAQRAVGERFRLTLVGPITAAWYRDQIVDRVNVLGLKGDFELIPGLPPGSLELERQFASAGVFVLPSVHEPFGIAALEALRRGVPLVSANVGGLRDFVVHEKNGLLFDPKDAKMLAERIGRLAQDAELRDRVSAAGLETARAYSWPRIIADLNHVYQHALLNNNSSI